jgi:hypothetical protein
METLANVSRLGVHELRDDELMEVNGGYWKYTLVKHVFRIIIDGLLNYAIRYVAKKVWVSVSTSSGNRSGRPNPGLGSL